jgi:Outer membrane protein beta-barrel domain
MKKGFLLSLAFLFVQLINAQVSGIGIRPAMSLSTYKLTKDYNDVYDTRLQPGAAFGAFVEINLGNRFTLQPEVNFVQRGVTLENETGVSWKGPDFGYPNAFNVVGFKQRETLNYIDIPLMVERNFGGGSFGAYVAAGPGIAFALGGKGREEVTVQNTTAEDPNAEQTDRSEYVVEMGSGRNDMYKGFDLNLNLGGGLIFLLERGEIGIDLRYTHGIKALNTERLRNRNFIVGVSYMHYLGN